MTVLLEGEKVADRPGWKLSFFETRKGVVCGSMVPVMMLNLTIRLSASRSGR
jgi:hypothetical protein